MSDGTTPAEIIFDLEELSTEHEDYPLSPQSAWSASSSDARAPSTDFEVDDDDEQEENGDSDKSQSTRDEGSEAAVALWISLEDLRSIDEAIDGPMSHLERRLLNLLSEDRGTSILNEFSDDFARRGFGPTAEAADIARQFAGSAQMLMERSDEVSELLQGFPLASGITDGREYEFHEEDLDRWMEDMGKWSLYEELDSTVGGERATRVVHAIEVWLEKGNTLVDTRKGSEDADLLMTAVSEMTAANEELRTSLGEWRQGWLEGAEAEERERRQQLMRAWRSPAREGSQIMRLDPVPEEREEDDG